MINKNTALVSTVVITKAVCIFTEACKSRLYLIDDLALI